METIKFMYFWLDYSDNNNHIERIPFAAKNINHHSCMAIEELLESDELHLFLLSYGTWIDDSEYL